GAGVEITRPVGGKQTLTFDGAEFLGYANPLKAHDDFAGKSVRGKAVVWSSTAPGGLTTDLLSLISPEERSVHILLETFAGASIAYAPNLVSQQNSFRT